MRSFAKNCVKGGGAWLILALVLIACSTPLGAQSKKDKKKAQQSDAAQAEVKALMPLPDAQAVDQAIGEMLGYTQIGDTDSLHKYYSDDIVVVSGAWEPPVIGWDNFLKAYLAQRASVQGGRLDRTNTVIKVNGNFAWATYQFVYTAMAQDKIVQFHGHTSLVLNKQGDRWLIVLNHSSVLDNGATNPPQAAANSAPPGNP
jgi:ketosteroid isomerase-like protein